FRDALIGTRALSAAHRTGFATGDRGAVGMGMLSKWRLRILGKTAWLGLGSQAGMGRTRRMGRLGMGKIRVN
ncbi:hypothetical protein PMAYCL1PPCAC_32180, partial [Pristionchus mayeri]